jgi:hypothetical protein
MTVNRAQRRAMKATAQATAAVLAARCYDFHAGGDLVRITAPAAVAALTPVLDDYIPTSDDDAVIPLDLILAAYDRDVEPIKTIMPVWGLDVARFGSNKTCLVKRQANVVTSCQSWSKRDTMEVAGIVMAEYESAKSDERPVTV